MSKLPSLTHNATIEIPSDCYWRAGLDNKVYWWKKTKQQTKRKSLEMNIYSDGITTIKKFPIARSSALLFVDRNSHLYFGKNLNIGGLVSVYSIGGEEQWIWEPKDKVHSFAVTVDKQGGLWFVTTEFDDTIYSYDPTNGLMSLPFPMEDIVYGIAIKVFDKIYSIQNPTVGHIVMCSDFSGNVLHQLGEVDPEKLHLNFNKADWPIYYPEDIFLDDMNRVWIEEMGRKCLTVLDSSLNIIGRYDHQDFALRSPYETEGHMNGSFKYGFGDKLLWVKEARNTPEIILYSYIIE